MWRYILGQESYDRFYAIMFISKIWFVQVIGSWDCLCKKCVEKHFQPRILFFVESAPTEIDQNMPPKSFFEEEESGKSQSGSKVNYEDSSGIFGAGLKNDVGENSCFLNAIIQVQFIPNF